MMKMPLGVLQGVVLGLAILLCLGVQVEAGTSSPTMNSSIPTPAPISTCKPYNFSAQVTDVTMWGWQGWYVLADIFVLFLVLFYELVPIEFAMVAAVLMLCSAKIILVTDMTYGFSSTGVLAIAVLLVVGEGLTSTGAIDYFMGKALGHPKHIGTALVRMMLPSAFIAAWVSSTAVVALMIPIVQRWAKRIQQPPSLLFIPLCYAVHLGGTVTVIGTTTNLVISGLYSQYYCETLGIFTVTQVGLPVAIAAMGFLLLFCPLVLPGWREYNRRIKQSYLPNEHVHKSRWARFRAGVCFCCPRWGRKGAQSHSEDTSLLGGGGGSSSGAGGVNGPEPWKKPRGDEFTFDALLPQGSSYHEHSVEDAGLRNIQGLFLVSVTRGSTPFLAVGPEFQLCAGDRLTFAGMSEAFVPFCRAKGLIPLSLQDGDGDTVISGRGPGESEEEEKDTMSTSTGGNPVAQRLLQEFSVEAVVAANSELVGRTMKEVSFRTRYHASVLSIHRAGAKVASTANTRLGQVPLKVGDVLSLVVGDKFSWDHAVTKRDLKPRGAVGKSNSSIGKTALPGDELAMPGEYVFSMRVSATPRQVGFRTLGGLTLDQAGLRNVSGVRVIAVARGGVLERDVGATYVLAANDVLYCVGDRDGLPNLRRVPGLEDVVNTAALNVEMKYRRLVEVVVSLDSPLLGKTVRESKFRTRFQAAIVSVQRRGQRVLAHIGDIELEPGDVLILEAGPEFVKRFAQDENFLVMSEIDQSATPRMDRFYLCVVACTAMVALCASTGWDVLFFALWVVGVMLATGVLSRERAHKAVDWKIIVTVATAFGLSTALANTSVASVIGNAIVALARETGSGYLGVLVVVMIFTEVLCALITAKAGAVLMFPIAATAAYQMGIPPITMVVALMMGSSDFTTPYGHPTNLMVVGPGAYQFVDYPKAGIPLEIFLNLAQVLCLAYINTWWATTLGSIGFLLLCIAIDRVFVSKVGLNPFRRDPPVGVEDHKETLDAT